MGRKFIDKRRYTDISIKKRYSIKLLVYFQNNGIRNFSMSELAKSFNVSKTTLYNHFFSKEEMIGSALEYKLSIISDYKSVLFNKDLEYVERYRKAMLFYCVQSFKVSRTLLFQIKEDYPGHWIKVVLFQRDLIKDLEMYYQLGQRIGFYDKSFDPKLLSLDDYQFFDMLSQRNKLDKENLDVSELFNHHYRLKFNGILVS